jgi:hypothetical protein
MIAMRDLTVEELKAVSGGFEPICKGRTIDHQKCPCPHPGADK